MAWLLVVLVALGWGSALVADAGVALRAAPFYGRWSWHPDARLVPAVLLAAATVALGPKVAASCRWRLLPVVTGAWAVAWAVALAASNGWSQVTAPLTTDHEYEPLAERIGSGWGDVGGFLEGYVDHLREYPIHVQGHPPGPVVAAWVLDRVGLGGAGWLAAAALAGWGAAVAVALVAVRALGDGQQGEAMARRAAPALAVLPAAVWAGTSMDAAFAGLTALAVGAAVLAAVHGSRRWAAVAGGIAGLALLATYGAPVVLLVGVGVVVVVAAHPVRLLLTSAAAALVPLGLAAGAGFWWPAGLAATGKAYWAGVGAARPALYTTLVGNPAALALACGPAVAVGLWAAVAHVRAATVGPLPEGAASVATAAPVGPRWVAADRCRALAQRVPPGVLLPVAALVAVGLADLSQMSRGEVERIWLPFVPWLALAAPGDRRGWLAAQAAVALSLQSILASAW